MNNIRDAVFHIKGGRPFDAARILRGVFNRSRSINKKRILLTVIMSLEGTGEYFGEKEILKNLRPFCNYPF